MKTLLFIVSLATALIAMPVVAQQGPAGVPGAPGLAPMTASAPLPPAPPPAQLKASTPPAKCGKTNKTCKPKKAAVPTCSSNADPARCERYRKAREVCSDLPERDYRQCLRDNLPTKK